MPGFNIKIGANTVEVTKSLNELKNDLANFQKQLAHAANPKEIVELNRQIQQTKTQIDRISGAQSLNALNVSLKQLPPGANQGAIALTNLGRVAQDAPFGFIAISNNIDPLIQSFIQLKAQSGSTQGALKALGSSLLGGGGLALAFSVVTSLVTYFSLQTRGAANELEGFAKAQADANKQAGEEIARLKILTVVSQDTTRSISERKNAAKELQELLKDYNIQLSQEAILNGQVAEATTAAKNAIIERAKARAIESRIAELAAKQLQLDIQRDIVQKQLKKNQDDYNKSLAEQQKLLENTGETAFGDLELESLVRDQQRLLQELEEGRTEIDKEMTELLNRIKDEDITPKFDTGKFKKDTDLLKQRIDALKQLQTEAGLTTQQQIELTQLEIKLAARDAVKLGFTKQELQQRIDDLIEKAFPVNSFEFKISPAIKINKEKISSDIDIAGAIGVDQIDLSSFDNIIKKLQEAAAIRNALFETDKEREYVEFISGTLGPAFIDLFSNIASDGSSAIEQFGRAIGDIIKKLIAAAATAAVLSTILSAIFPGAGKSVTGFKAIFGQLSGFKFAEGGIITGPTLGLIGERNRPEAVLPLDRLPQILGQLGGGSGGGTLTARVSGRELLFILEQEQRSQNRVF